MLLVCNIKLYNATCTCLYWLRSPDGSGVGLSPRSLFGMGGWLDGMSYNFTLVNGFDIQTTIDFFPQRMIGKVFQFQQLSMVLLDTEKSH